MEAKKLFTLLIGAYLTVCAGLILGSGISTTRRDAKKGVFFLAAEAKLPVERKPSASTQEVLEIAPLPQAKGEIAATSEEERKFTLGSADPKNSYKLEINLTNKGAGILSVRLRDYDDRDYKNPKPLELLSPVGRNASMASKKLLLPELAKSFPLEKLNWQTDGVIQSPDGSQTITFHANIFKDSREFLKITKVYTLKSEDYLLDCKITIKNETIDEVKVALETAGPIGIAKENERADTRTITTGFLTDRQTVETTKLNIKKLADDFGGKAVLFHKNAEYKFLWTSISDKYFTAIIRPVPQDPNKLFAEWVLEKTGLYFNPDNIANSGDENIGVQLGTINVAIAPKSQHEFKFQVYIGPKDRHLFKENSLYNQLGFIQVIDFQACCGDLFRGLSFLILAAMAWLHQYIPNYGVVIIIFVFVVRILLHPITKRSQISMMRMAKLGPKAEEIRQKYADNKAEMNKQLAELYREHGIAPILGCLPMFLQMPIWIALYSAIYAGIEFRGARFLPFWITDLSRPDAVFYLPTFVEGIPLIGTFIGDSFNLLPILLAVAMVAQQKLTSSSAPSTNPQAAQQQKIMMWMMPMILLLALYRAPSGLNLYIMSSTLAGVVEQYVIKKHIEEKEALEQAGLVPTTSKLGGKLKKKKPKPPIRFS